MPSPYSETDRQRVCLTLEDIEKTIRQLTAWNNRITSTDDYYASEQGMQLLTANCTLITAIGEGINRCDKILPGFLSSHFPEIPWRAITGMRNHIAHGYFELDADIVFDAVKTDIPPLLSAITAAIALLR